MSIEARRLGDFITDIFSAAGCFRDAARRIAGNLVKAGECGGVAAPGAEA